jgi:3-methyladenine DNA glycosylase AlkD
VDAAAQIAKEIAALPRRDTPSMRAVRRTWSQVLKSAPGDEVLAIAKAVEGGMAQTGKWVGYELIRFHPAAFAAIAEADVADFASRLASWYAVDAFGTILAGPLWARGRLSDDVVDRWSMSEDRWLRRSALVATVGLNARASGGAGDSVRTLAICRRLAPDRDDMVEKAMSWALRFLSQRDRPSVEGFMIEMDGKLAARVVREVGNKLATGLKTPRRRA